MKRKYNEIFETLKEVTLTYETKISEYEHMVYYFYKI